MATQWSGTTGQLSRSRMSPSSRARICLPLNEFATAAVEADEVLGARRDGAGRRRPALDDGRRPEARRPSQGREDAAPVLPRRRYARRRCRRVLGRDTRATPIAILTLAHESIHLGGVVGGRLSNGLAAGDQQAEAKADCSGMQWMPYVAEQLGDTPDDAQAIATYFWDKIYPLSRATHPEYWSPDCRPGGALDAHLPGATAWP